MGSIIVLSALILATIFAIYYLFNEASIQLESPTIAAVEACDEALFAMPIRSAGGVTGPLASVLHSVAVQHILGHMRDILGRGDAG